MNDKFHEMVLERTHVSGVEEWYCPSCGRRFLVQWPPAYKMIVIEQGEKDTRHNVSKVNSRTIPVKRRETLEVDESRLMPWLAWMEKVDFEGLWNKYAQ